MRLHHALVVSAALGVAVFSPFVATAQVQRYDYPNVGVSFEAPATWTVGPGEPRGYLPNEQLNIKASGSPTAALNIVVYRLDPPLDEANRASALAAQDQQFQAWVAKQPGSGPVQASDIEMDGVAGREYLYNYMVGGQLVNGDTILVPKGGTLIEISQWSQDGADDDKLPLLLDMFSSVQLPWSPPASGA